MFAHCRYSIRPGWGAVAMSRPAYAVAGATSGVARGSPDAVLVGDRGDNTC